MVKGNAAFSFTVFFLYMWDYLTNGEEDYSAIIGDGPVYSQQGGQGFVLPYCDAPGNREHVGENAYVNMISRSAKYCYICTPYLVIDEDLRTALVNAARSGVDVRIVTPGIPDKWYVHMLSRSWYRDLIDCGVKIYEYTPGFIHSKTVVCDDSTAICGTINFDLRSFNFLHECAVWMQGTKAVLDMRNSFLEMLPQCHEITKDWCAAIHWGKRLGQSLLRLFAPLM